MLVSIWGTWAANAGVAGGLDAIPQAYFDAALVDGAGAWRRSGASSLPLLRPVTWFVFLTGVISALQMFTLVFVSPRAARSRCMRPDVVAIDLPDRIWTAALGMASGWP